MSVTVVIKKQRFVAALVGGASVAEAAALVGRCQRTAERWLSSDTEVREAVKGEQTRLLRRLSLASLGAAQDSIKVLAAIRDDTATAPYVRVTAAKALLDAGLRLAELVSLNDRVSAIETTLAKHLPA